MSTSRFMRYPKDRLAALASASALRAIREGLLWTMPCLLVSALFLVLSVVAGPARPPPGRGQNHAPPQPTQKTKNPIKVGPNVGKIV
ncbi:PTS sugar transporter subunit IIC, partial [Achromobacter xylosoxidans]